MNLQQEARDWINNSRHKPVPTRESTREFAEQNSRLKLVNPTLYGHGYRVIGELGNGCFRIDLRAVSDPKIVRLY